MDLSLPLFPELDGLPALPGGLQAGGPAAQRLVADVLAADVLAADVLAADALVADTQAADPLDADDPISSALTDPLAGLDVQPLRDPATLHPGVWRASQIGGAPRRTVPSGFAALDAQLPGGGWPHGVLTELLLPHPGVGELRLLAPALATVSPLVAPGVATPSSGQGLDTGRCVMLFDPPAALSAWALLRCGLNSRHWLVVQGRVGQAKPGQGGTSAAGRSAPRSANRLAPLLPGADVLWALEQALKSGHVGAILAWLPLNLRVDALRRLQMAAQAHDGPVFILRDALAASRPSPAPLRLLLQPAGVDGLSLRLLKRRGPPLAQPLRLVLPSVLAPHLQAQAQADELLREAVHGTSQPQPQRH